MIKHSLLFVPILTCLMMFSCGDSPKNKDEAYAEALAFGENYFSFRFDEALKHSTSESARVIEFVASNIDDSDIVKIVGMETLPEVEVVNVERNSDNDSMAIATLDVNDVFLVDSIGKTGYVVDEARFRVPMVFRNGKWLVKMEAPLRNEKLDLD